MGLPPSRDDIVTSHEILNDHGLAAPNWPVEWGGLARRVGRKGLDPTQHQIWLDEMQLASARLAPPSGCGAAACMLSLHDSNGYEAGHLRASGVSGTPANLST
ncbi:MAG: hypothetical protein ABWY20_22040 [Mycobacterium sp.]